MNLSEKARRYAIKLHADTNHLYDGQPYYVHLNMVVFFAQKYIHLVSQDNQDIVLAACWLHDTIEDCRVTYNDISSEFGEEVAEIVYALTNEKGKTRKERANEKYYQGIRDNGLAVFVKICDRMANVQYSKKNKSNMFFVYKKENLAFKQEMHHPIYSRMLSNLDSLINENKY